MKLTIKCKLIPTQKQCEILQKTLSKCLGASNYISQIAFKHACYNRVALHHLVYFKVKAKFKLPAQISTQIRDKVAFTYQADKKKLHVFKNPIVPLNFTRTVSLKSFISASICTLSGRQKIILDLGTYQKQMLSKAVKFCDSELIKQRNKFFLNIAIEIDEEKERIMKDVLGVDLGIKNIATCSNGETFSGRKVQSVRRNYNLLRSSLQKKGTRSAKRHLKKDIWQRETVSKRCESLYF